MKIKRAKLILVKVLGTTLNEKVQPLITYCRFIILGILLRIKVVPNTTGR